MRWALLLLCCYTQAENPIGADAITYLDDEHWSWVRADDGFTIPASVPGDVVTDLERAGAIGDPLLDDNFIARRANVESHVDAADDLSRRGATPHAFCWCSMASRWARAYASTTVPLGTVRDQFLRYVFDVRNASIDLLRETNKLELIFDPSIDVAGRFAACSGGWDWAPYVSQ